jgi:hypothetical protein
MHTIMLLILVILLFSALPTWPYGVFGSSRHHRPSRPYSGTRPVRELGMGNVPFSAWVTGEHYAAKAANLTYRSRLTSRTSEGRAGGSQGFLARIAKLDSQGGFQF